MAESAPSNMAERLKFGHIGNWSRTGGQRVKNRAAYNAPAVVQPPQVSSSTVRGLPLPRIWHLSSLP